MSQHEQQLVRMAGIVHTLRSQLAEAKSLYLDLLEEYQEAINELGARERYLEQVIQEDPLLFIFKHLRVSNNDQPARIIAQMLTPDALDHMINVAHRIEDIGEDMLNRPRPPVPAGPPAPA